MPSVMREAATGSRVFFRDFPQEFRFARDEPASAILAGSMSPLEHGDELFRLAVESAPNAMILVDADGKIALVNAQTEKLFGYPRSELLGQSIEMLVPARFRGAHPGQRESFRAEPRARAMGAGRELYAIKKDGAEVPVEIGLNPIRTAEGAFVLAAIVDLTATKAMQAELVRTQRLAALGEMAATVAHEVKNPLAAISGPLQILSDDLKPDDPHKELMKEILGQVKRLDNTVRGLLAFSKPTTPRKQTIALREFVERIARLVGDQEAQRGVQFLFEGERELTLNADPTLLEQVLWNLFLNSAEAMKGSGQVRVTLQSSAADVTIAIADSGGGIARELVPKLFRPFVTTKTTGTGLGLALCRKIVEAHRGTIDIRSDPGRGATVLMTFPRS